MREIKFRSWDSENEQYWDWSSDMIALDFWYHARVQKQVIEQFTGLHDKNGVEIYEGDIVKIPDDWEEYGFMAGESREVYFSDGCFRLKPLNNLRGRGPTIQDDMDKCVVTGSIHSRS